MSSHTDEESDGCDDARDSWASDSASGGSIHGDVQGAGGRRYACLLGRAVGWLIGRLAVAGGIEQALRAIRPAEAYFRATHGGAELDLLIFRRGRRYGMEAKFSEAPEVTRSMDSAL